MRARKAERNKKALEMRRAGMTYKDIAQELGLKSLGTLYRIIKNEEKRDQEGK